MGLVPNFNRLDKGAGREHTVALRTHTGTDDLGTNGTGDSGAKYPFVWWRNLRERDYLFPDLIGRCLNIDAGAHNEYVSRPGKKVFGRLYSWDDQQQGEHRRC